MKKYLIWIPAGVFGIFFLSSGLVGQTSTFNTNLTGIQEIYNWDGVTRTFTQTIADGLTLPFAKPGNVVDVLAAYGGGATTKQATLQSAITAIGSSAVGLVLQPGTWSINSNLTIPANATLLTPPGAVLSVATGSTLTINGGLDAGSYQIFSSTGTGKVVFGGSVPVAYPEWWYAGGGDWASAINAAVQSLSSGEVRINSATTISTSIVAKSNVNLVGTGSIAPTTAAVNFLVSLGGLSNIRVSGITFNGGGSWSRTAFANPAGGGNSVGFTCLTHGVVALTTADRIQIDHCHFTGLEQGIYGYFTNTKIGPNSFQNLGMSAISLFNSSGVNLVSNDINGVQGNITSAGDTNVADSKYADGVYFHDCAKCTQTGGVVQDIKRIGTVFEGDSVTLNDNIAVSGVTYRNLNSCRGTEYNAAVWSEEGRSRATLTVTGCIMNNEGATPGANPSYGIVAYGLVASRNNIRYFAAGVVAKNDSTITGNTIQNNTYGVDVYGLTSGKATSIIGNDISYNTKTGIIIDSSHGTIRITGGNIFKHNGTGRALLTGPGGNSGIDIGKHYSDQKLIINGNTFE